MAGADSDLEQGIASTELVNGNRSPRLGDGLFRVAVCYHPRKRCNTDADRLPVYREVARFALSHQICLVFLMSHLNTSEKHVSAAGRV